MASTTVSTATDNPAPATTGVRPEVKIGGDLSTPSTDGTAGSPCGTWNFCYHPGDQNINMLVQADQNCMLTNTANSSGISMEIDQQGINDIISWLCGVKNLVSEAVKKAAQNSQDTSSPSDSSKSK